jgi:hypothetical protein
MGRSGGHVQGGPRAGRKHRRVKPQEWKFLHTKFVLHLILFSSGDFSGQTIPKQINNVGCQ